MSQRTKRGMLSMSALFAALIAASSSPPAQESPAAKLSAEPAPLPLPAPPPGLERNFDRILEEQNCLGRPTREERATCYDIAHHMVKLEARLCADPEDPVCPRRSRK